MDSPIPNLIASPIASPKASPIGHTKAHFIRVPIANPIANPRASSGAIDFVVAADKAILPIYLRTCLILLGHLLVSFPMS